MWHLFLLLLPVEFAAITSTARNGVRAAAAVLRLDNNAASTSVDVARADTDRVLMRREFTERIHALIEDPVASGNFADGCQHVFLDIGSNRGVHVRSLYEPARYPELTTYWALAAKESDAFNVFLRFRTGELHNTSVCAFGFEANPDFTPRLQSLEKAYQKMGWSVKFFAPVAVWNHTGELSFWREPAGVQLGGEVRDTTPYLGISIKEQVQATDLMQFLTDHILHRRKLDSNAPSSIVMKMDIEGSEFTVLPHLLAHGALCKGTGIDAITIEWHGDGKKHNAVGAGPGAALLTKEITSQGNGCTPTDLLDVNDELLFDDEKSLPTGDPLPPVLHQKQL